MTLSHSITAVKPLTLEDIIMRGPWGWKKGGIDVATLESIIMRGRWEKASMDVVSLYISKDKSEVAK